MLEINKEWHSREVHTNQHDNHIVMFKYDFGKKSVVVNVLKVNVDDFYGTRGDFPLVAEKFYQEHVEKIRKCVMDTYFPEGVSYDSVPDVVTIYLHPSLGGYALDADQGEVNR